MLLVDAANVIGSRPNGWWRDRPGAARRFVEGVRAAVAVGRLDPPVVVVLEGAARDGAVEAVVGGVEVVHAPGEGDDTIAALAGGASTESSPIGSSPIDGIDVIVVTADRELAGRVRAVGAEVVGPRWLLDLLRD